MILLVTLGPLEVFKDKCMKIKKGFMLETKVSSY